MVERQRAVVILAAMSLALAVASSAAAAPLTVPKPTIAITSPANGATVDGPTVTIHVAIAHFKLVPPVLLSPAQWKTIPLLKGNQGHIHYVLDSIANLVLTRDVTVRLDHTWTHVSPGWHTVSAYLATSQHAPFPGARPAIIHIHVVRTIARTARPSIRITGVQYHDTDQGMDLNVHVAVSHFKLVPPVFFNPPKLPGNQGHIHYVLDRLSNFNTLRDAAIALNHPWYHVSPGRHTIIAYLATSQHQFFPGTQPARISIDVPQTHAGGSTLRIVKVLPRTGGALDNEPGQSLVEILAGIAACTLGLWLLVYSVKRL